MKELSASAEGVADAPLERCFALAADVESYPHWYPAGVKYAEALEREPDGQVTKVATTLALAQGPIQRDFRLDMAVTSTDRRRVELRRVPRRPDDPESVVIAWELDALSAERTRIAVELSAELDIPRFLPTGGIAESVANGFLGAALDALRC